MDVVQAFDVAAFPVETVGFEVAKARLDSIALPIQSDQGIVGR